MNPGAITLVGVWAHPDDETYLSATLMHRVMRAGGRVVVITATAGEQGVTGADDSSTSTRRDELRRALAAVGVDELLMHGIADGTCSHEDHDHRSQQISALLDDVHPDAVVTFGPDGITGHPDHIAVSAWTLAACRNRDCDIHLATISTSFHTMHHQLHERIGLSMSDHQLTTVDDHLITARLTPSPGEHEAKLRAFAAHRSQTSPIRQLIGDAAFESWWIDETFRHPTSHDLHWAHDITPSR